MHELAPFAVLHVFYIALQEHRMPLPSGAHNSNAMKKSILAAAIFTSAIFAACTSNSTQQSENEQTTDTSEVEMAKDRVMEIHDIAMAKMSKMGNLRIQLGNMRDTLNPVAEIDTAIWDLQTAHDEMMNWMGQYKDIESTTSDETEILSYLDSEHQKISLVAEQIDRAIRNAEELIARLENAESK